MKGTKSMVPSSRKNEFVKMSAIEGDVDRLFGMSLPRWFDADRNLFKHDWNPDVDIRQTKDNIEVRADMPGVSKNDIYVAVKGDVLTVKGEKKHEKEEKGKGFVRSERFYGSFSKSIMLPCAVDAAKANVHYKDGVLKLSLPKKHGAMSKQVQIKVK